MSINNQKKLVLDTATNQSNLHNLPQYVLITGPGRSGTTWLGQIMNTYQNCIYKYEPFLPIKQTSYSTWKESLDSTDIEKLRDDFWSLCNSCNYQVDLPPFPLKTFRKQNKEVLRFLYTMGKKVELAKHLYQSYGRPSITKDTAVLIKDVNFPNQTLPRLCEVLEPHLIGLIRNPFANIASYFKGLELNLFAKEHNQEIAKLKQSLDTPQGQHLTQYRDRLETMSVSQFEAVRWRFQVEPLAEYIRTHEKSLLVVYEDLCNDPQGKVAEIFDFVGWKFDSGVRDFINLSTAQKTKAAKSSKAYYSVYRDPKKSMSKWKTQLTKEQKVDIASIIYDSPLKDLWNDLPL